MREYRLLIILFCATLVMICVDWPQTWPIAAGAAAMFYGFYRWVWVELLGWFSVILAVLTFAMLINVFHPFSAMLLFLVSLLGCAVFTRWEGAVVVGDGWQAWRRWRERRKGSVSERRWSADKSAQLVYVHTGMSGISGSQESCWERPHT